MSISPWLILALAVPVLLAGEFLVRKIGFLSRFNIPAPVAGGLVVSIVVWIVNVSGIELALDTKVDTRWWNWFVLPEPDWLAEPPPKQDVYRIFLVGFFVSIGLNASWNLAKRAGRQLAWFSLFAALLVFLQNGVGVALASALGESPLLGLLCGSIALTGGHGTAIGFSDVIVEAGYESASVVGIAAATFGLVFAGLLGGPVGGYLIKKRNLKADDGDDPTGRPSLGMDKALTPAPSGFVAETKAVISYGKSALLHLFIILVCIKVGAWVSLFITKADLTFPVYIGAMMVGVLSRNVIDAIKPGLMNTRLIDLFAAVFLGVFLSVALMALNLIQLANAAGPMLVILFAQVAVMAVFALVVTFNVMGRDYDAAVMAAGHCGFGLGATPAAVANMKALTEKYGSAPRAFLIIPLVGAFLIDFINSSIITFYLNALGS